MRPGPKFEVTFEMAVANVRRVAERLGGSSRLSRRMYDAHGSFSVRALERKFGWNALVCSAGLLCGVPGAPRRPRRLCVQGCGRMAMTLPGCLTCRTCTRRQRRQAVGAMLLDVAYRSER